MHNESYANALQTVFFLPRSGPTKHLVRSGSKLFDTLMVFLKVFFKKSWFFSRLQKSMKNYPVGKTLMFLLPSSLDCLCSKWTMSFVSPSMTCGVESKHINFLSKSSTLILDIVRLAPISDLPFLKQSKCMLTLLPLFTTNVVCFPSSLCTLEASFANNMDPDQTAIHSSKCLLTW